MTTLTPDRALGEYRKAAIKRCYGLKRQITDAELLAELVSLRRKRADGSLDTRQEFLASQVLQ